MGNIHGYNQTYWTKSTELRTDYEKRNSQSTLTQAPKLKTKTRFLPINPFHATDFCFLFSEGIEKEACEMKWVNFFSNFCVLANQHTTLIRQA